MRTYRLTLERKDTFGYYRIHREMIRVKDLKTIANALRKVSKKEAK